ncbi:ATP-dependent DNA helicase DinG [Bacillus mangrovi]|uniref:3'-5' exonuclease DinG n=1 Tax=Metabacillus mangrovi TaxID=1491830 RepID=A0A7X2V3L6_9BACI|nr:ATP-dependent DNA helicase DinG [Metabacillus mangrovi]MTH52138.1 ATP-dependent DNA helicase DinG [Metabacillus mangrovi]
MDDRRYVVLDVETTGSSPKKGEKIIQFAAVVWENGRISERFMSYVNPLKPIPAFIEELTGISTEMVEGAPVFSDIAADICRLLDGASFVAHNVHFDLSYVQAELEQAGYPRFMGSIMDTVELSRLMFPSFESYKLSELCRELEILHDRPHQADSDAEATAEIFGLILSRLEKLPLVTLKSLRKLSEAFISDLDEVLEEIIERKGDFPSTASGNRTEVFGSLAFSPVFTRKEEPLPEKASQPDFSELFLRMEESISGYEERNHQQQLMLSVYEALANREHLLAEAPAGTGKSIGLLIPSLKYALETGKGFIYSTHTVTLQNQLLEKDLPLAEKILGKRIKAAVLKGESHYICPHKFELALMEKDDNYDSNLTKSQLLIWLQETETGDADELNIPSGGRMLWERIHHDHLSAHPDNPYRDRSFYHLARKKAEQSQVVIVNHALLLNDAANGRQQLPDTEEILIDEAHHLERIAGDQWGVRLEYASIHAWLQRIGHLYSDNLLAAAAGWFENNSEKGYDLCLELDVLLKEFSEELDEFFTALHSTVLRKKKTSGNWVSYTVDELVLEDPYWQAIGELADRIRFYILDLTSIMKKQKQLLSHMELPLKVQTRMNEYFSIAEKLQKAGEAVSLLFSTGASDTAGWIEVEAKGAKNAAALCSRPVAIGEMLAGSLFEKHRSVILASGTLAVNGSFDYCIRELGLADFYPKKLILPQAYDYRKQAKLFIPSDIPGIRDVSQEKYTEAAAEGIAEFVRTVKGKALVLFTSFEMLRSTQQHLKANEQLSDYTVLGQGSGAGGKGKLIKSFRQLDKALLLGTNSFWEGIDLPGEELEAIIMVRLPFAPPDQPVNSAKTKRIEREGKNGFYDFSLPEAVLKYRQGFGRLIRSGRDRGVLMVMDRRILTARYGQSFLQAVPGLEVHYKPVKELAEIAADWLKK